jgi:type I restriction enzyme M protein
MRRKLVEHDVVETVLGLGPNLFYNSPMEACVVICRMKKSRNRKGRIQFINAVNEVSRERAQSFLTDAHISRIVATYKSDDEVPEFSRLVSLEEIRSQQHNLSIPLYVRTEMITTNGNSHPHGSVKDSIGEWQTASRQLRKSMDNLFSTFKEAGVGK